MEDITLYPPSADLHDMTIDASVTEEILASMGMQAHQPVAPVAECVTIASATAPIALSIAASPALSPTSSFTTLTHVVTELATTEKNYIASMKTLLEQFIAPLVQQQKLATNLGLSEHACRVWQGCHGALVSIVTLHENIDKDFRDAGFIGMNSSPLLQPMIAPSPAASPVSDDPSPSPSAQLVNRVSHILLKHSHYLKLYTAFVDSHCAVRTLLDFAFSTTIAEKNCDKKKWNRWLDETTKHHAQGQNIQSFLIMPVQRSRKNTSLELAASPIDSLTQFRGWLIFPLYSIPRYELLLSKIEEVFTKDSVLTPADLAALTQLRLAKNAINVMNRHLNEWQREGEAKQRLWTLSEQVKRLPGYEILESHRKYIADIVAVQVYPNPSARKSLHLWLCTDILILVSMKNCKIKGWLKLVDIVEVRSHEIDSVANKEKHLESITCPEKCLTIESFSAAAASVPSSSSNGSATSTAFTSSSSNSGSKSFTPQQQQKTFAARLFFTPSSSSASASSTGASPSTNQSTLLTPSHTHSQSTSSLPTLAGSSNQHTSILCYEFPDLPSRTRWMNLLTQAIQVAQAKESAPCGNGAISRSGSFSTNNITGHKHSLSASASCSHATVQASSSSATPSLIEQSQAKRQKLLDGGSSHCTPIKPTHTSVSQQVLQQLRSPDSETLPSIPMDESFHDLENDKEKAGEGEETNNDHLAQHINRSLAAELQQHETQSSEHNDRAHESGLSGIAEENDTDLLSGSLSNRSIGSNRPSTGSIVGTGAEAMELDAAICTSSRRHSRHDGQRNPTDSTDSVASMEIDETDVHLQLIRERTPSQTGPVQREGTALPQDTYISTAEAIMLDDSCVSASSVVASSQSSSPVLSAAVSPAEPIPSIAVSEAISPPTLLELAAEPMDLIEAELLQPITMESTIGVHLEPSLSTSTATVPVVIPKLNFSLSNNIPSGTATSKSPFPSRKSTTSVSTPRSSTLYNPTASSSLHAAAAAVSGNQIPPSGSLSARKRSSTTGITPRVPTVLQPTSLPISQPCPLPLGPGVKSYLAPTKASVARRKDQAASVDTMVATPRGIALTPRTSKTAGKKVLSGVSSTSAPSERADLLAAGTEMALASICDAPPMVDIISLPHQTHRQTEVVKPAESSILSPRMLQPRSQTPATKSLTPASMKQSHPHVPTLTLPIANRNGKENA